MNNYLVESDIELAAIEWLQDAGWRYMEGPEVHRSLKKVVLEDLLDNFLRKKYSHLPEKAVREAFQAFLYNAGTDLDTRNHNFHLKLSKGIDISWKDEQGQEHFEHLYCVDYDNPFNNDFLAVNQFSIEGKNNRRPDLILFVNGLPLVLFEFKNLFDTEATVENAFNQVQHYIEDIPQVFENNAITVISDGQTTLHGMYSSSIEWFAAWKSTDGVTVVQEDFALETLINGILTPQRLLQYIRFYIFHGLVGNKLIKKGAKYHQFFGIQYALKHTLSAIKPLGDGRIGVIWHTTRSGKSITMAIYTAILRQMPELKNPTIVVQVDRYDLDKQLFADFVEAKDLVGDVKRADNTDELRELLSGEGGGVVFSTIEKFRLKETSFGKEESHPVLSTRDNIIVIADECHRTQYGLIEGFAHNLRRALPNASFIGFTGTPVDTKNADTVQVFGEIIHVYDIKQATNDKAVVPIYYEPRLAKLHLANEQIEEEAEEILGASSHSERNRVMWAAIEDAAGADERVEQIAKDILQHYTKRTTGGGSIEGKAMIMCMSRRNCVKMYNALSKLPGCPEIAVVMTTNIAKDPKDWNPHVRTKDAMEAVKEKFTNPDDPLKIVIVRDMWLTGFDNPCLHTLYVDKIMSGHNLIQSINRVSTIFKDKPSGLIVDYIGIADRLRDATKKYTGSGGTGEVTIDIEEAFALTREVLDDIRKQFPAELNYSQWRGMKEGDKLKLVSRAVNFIVKDDDPCKLFVLNEKKLSALAPIVKSHDSIAEISLDIIFWQHVGAAVRKIKYPVTSIRKKEEQIKELIHRSIDSEAVVDVFEMAGIPKFDISIINDDFLESAKIQKTGTEIKLELIRQIINNEIKVRQYKNLIKYKKIKDEVERILKEYHNHFFDSLIALQKLREVAREIQEADSRRQVLGLSDEEEAFYEILASHKAAISDFELIKDIVKDVTAAIKKNLQIDWFKKPDARAQILLAVKKVLKNRVVGDELQVILGEIMEQADARYREVNA